MFQKLISEEELFLLLPSRGREEEVEEREQPKKTELPMKKAALTMKYLNELITEAQYENLILFNRINKLEQQMNEYYRIRGEVAAAFEEAKAAVAAAEQPVPEKPGMASGREFDLPPYASQANLIPRSERHPAPKRKSLLSFWTRSR